MNLFLVLIVAGSIGGVWGPLPYDMAECQQRAAEAMEELIQKSSDRGVDLSHWSMRCERRLTRPQLGDRR